MEKTLSMGAFTELDEREVMETEGGSIIGTAVVVGLVLSGIAVVGLDCWCYAKNSMAATDAQKLANASNEPCPYDKIGPSAYVGAYINGWRPTETQELPQGIAYPS